MHGLSRRVRQLERRSGADGRFVSLPLSAESGQVVRLPRSFVEHLVKKGQELHAGGRYYNHTDQQWVEC